jgi:hypothetical protein
MSTTKNKGKKFENFIIEEYNLISLKDYNLKTNLKYSGSIRIKTNLTGKNIYEKLNKWIDYETDIIDFEKSVFTKGDAVDPITNFLCEIKKIGNKKEFMLCEVFAIKDGGIKFKKYMTIDEYNRKINLLHEKYGKLISEKISNEFRLNNIDIYTDKGILKIDKDFYIESNVTNGRNGKDINDKRWEFLCKII